MLMKENLEFCCRYRRGYPDERYIWGIVGTGGESGENALSKGIRGRRVQDCCEGRKRIRYDEVDGGWILDNGILFKVLRCKLRRSCGDDTRWKIMNCVFACQMRKPCDVSL